MAGKKLSSKAQQKLELLVQAQRKTDRLYSLVEQYAGASADHFASMISRAATELGRVLLNAGFGVMADHANQMAMLARRGGATQSKFRGLRELVNHLNGELDRARKKVESEDEEGEGEGS